MTTTKHKILFVDDEPNILRAYQRQLRDDYKVEIARSGKVGLEYLAERGPFAVVVSDMQMPEMNGIEFLQAVQEGAPETVRVMLTGKVDEGVAVQAVNESNIFRFLNKPCTMDELKIAVRDAAAQYELITAEKDLLQNTLSGSVKLLTDILSLVSPQSFGETMQLRDSIRKIAKELDPKNSWAIELAAMLSDIGMITLPDTIAEKARNGQTLTQTEQELVTTVPITSESLITNIPRLKSVAKIVRYVQKNYDGTGAPSDETQGEKLPLGSRIIHALRDFSRLEAELESQEASLASLRAQAGKYDPVVLDSIGKVLVGEQREKENEETKIFEINVQQLCVGQRLLADVKTLDGVLLITAGSEVTELVQGRIVNYADAVGVQEPLTVDALTPVEGI